MEEMEEMLKKRKTASTNVCRLSWLTLLFICGKTSCHILYTDDICGSEDPAVKASR